VQLMSCMRARFAHTSVLYDLPVKSISGMIVLPSALPKRRKGADFWAGRTRKNSNFGFWLATQSSVQLLSRIGACFARTSVLYNLLVKLVYYMPG